MIKSVASLELIDCRDRYVGDSLVGLHCVVRVRRHANDRIAGWCRPSTFWPKLREKILVFQIISLALGEPPGGSHH